MSLVCNLFPGYPIVLTFCTEHSSVLCAKFQNDWTTEMDVIDERYFARFEVKMRLGRTSLQCPKK